jgi:Fe2+ or Zn2+ uptake regulation protein
MTATRNTQQRAIVLQAVQAVDTHPTAADIYDAVHVEHPNVSRATVYRNLAVLSSQGKILHIAVPDGADRYDRRTDTHCHAICRVCGKVTDIEVSKTTPNIGIRDDHGFQVEGAQLMFTGICASCAEKLEELSK